MKFENKESVVPGFFLAVIVVIALGIVGIISNSIKEPEKREELFQENPKFDIEAFKSIFTKKD
jgi:hypothetical protein